MQKGLIEEKEFETIYNSSNKKIRNARAISQGEKSRQNFADRVRNLVRLTFDRRKVLGSEAYLIMDRFGGAIFPHRLEPRINSRDF